MRNLLRGIALALLLATLPLAANAGVFVSVSIGPPVLPVYVPPPVPGPGYIWAPGYWAWSGAEYYWVPGTWVLAPAPGLLWTPGYWGWAGGVYAWHAGYWGPHVGFYGGINYGFGYGGVGYHGGYWRGGEFVVNRTVINEAPVNRVSFNGGAGGIVAHATPEELRAAHEQHVGMSEAQRQHEQMASRDKTMFASYNHGSPSVAATQKPGVFYGHGVVAARSPSAQTHAAAGAPSGGHPGGQPGSHGSYAGAPHAYTGAPRAAPGNGGYPHGAAGAQAYAHPPQARAGEPQARGGEPQGRGGEHPEHGR
jgi:WXXGXW repeat (2 copies)